MQNAAAEELLVEYLQLTGPELDAARGFARAGLPFIPPGEVDYMVHVLLYNITFNVRVRVINNTIEAYLSDGVNAIIQGVLWLKSQGVGLTMMSLLFDQATWNPSPGIYNFGIKTDTGRPAEQVEYYFTTENVMQTTPNIYVHVSAIAAMVNGTTVKVNGIPQNREPDREWDKEVERRRVEAIKLAALDLIASGKIPANVS